MFRVIIALFLLAKHSNGSGQDFIICPDTDKVLYCRVFNSLTVRVNNVTCDQIMLQADSCEIIKDSCRFTIRPLSVNYTQTEIKVYRKANDSIIKIGTAVFRNKILDPPVVYIGNLKPGVVPAKSIVAMGGVTAGLKNQLICGYFEVKNYYISVIRKGKVIFGVSNEGARFSTEVVDVLRTLEANDRLIVSGICVQYPDSTLENLAPVEYIIAG